VAAAAGAALTGLVLAGALPAVARPAGPAGPAGVPAAMAQWEPAYTSYLLLSDTDDLITLERQGDTLWLATERVVSRYRDGVWSEPEVVAEDAMVLALAPLGDSGDALAFGFEGGIWRRRDGAWSAVSSPTSADLYDAYAWNGQEAWAVGFDYDASRGTVVHHTALGPSAWSPPWLARRQLLTIDASATGELWSGGCDGNDFPFLMRDQGAGEWVPAEVPPVSGCVEDMAFTADGRGLAAVDGDLLWFDGHDWHAFGQPPPEGHHWVRVALAADGEASGDWGGPPLGWAIPGTPTWRGYINGQAPWYFDGARWSELEVDYRGYDALFRPSETLPGAQPFVDVVSAPGAPIAVCRSVIQAQQPGQRRAGLMQLTATRARLEHPLIFSLGFPAFGNPAPQGMGAVAVSGRDAVWAGARLGAAPLIGRTRSVGWRVAPGAPAERGRDFWVQALDFAPSGAGWAFGGTSVGYAGTPAAWRLIGDRWREAPAPDQAQRFAVQLRALPDGGAWALAGASRLQSFDGAQWQELGSDTPALGPAWAPDGQNQLVSLRAPFDAVAGPPGSLLGWAASRDQMYLISGGRFQAMQDIPRGQVLDLQLVDGGGGWAIGYQDWRRAGARPPGVLLRLTDRTWSEIDLTAALTRAVALGSDPAVEPRSARWWLMSVVSDAEVWLYGGMTLTDRPESVVPLLVRFRAGERGAEPRDVILVRDCVIDALSAVAVPGGGTDVWLMSRNQCGPGAGHVANPYAGPVSVLRVRDTSDTLHLPSISRGARLDVGLR